MGAPSPYKGRVGSVVGLCMGGVLTGIPQHKGPQKGADMPAAGVVWLARGAENAGNTVAGGDRLVFGPNEL